MSVRAEDWPGFSKHASIQAIEYHLAEAERRLTRTQNEVHRLRRLAAERAEQIRNGEWPPKREGVREDG